MEVGGGDIFPGSTVKFTGAVGDNEVGLLGDGVEDVSIVDGGWIAAGSREVGREMLGSTCLERCRDGAIGVLCLRDRQFLDCVLGKRSGGPRSSTET